MAGAAGAGNRVAKRRLDISPAQTAQLPNRVEPNRAERRRSANWRRKIRELKRDGGGRWSAEIIRIDYFSDISPLMADPVRGSVIAGWINAVTKAFEPPLCPEPEPWHEPVEGAALLDVL